MHLWLAQMGTEDVEVATGEPQHPTDYFVQLRLFISDGPNRPVEKFSLTVCSPSALGQARTASPAPFVLPRFKLESIEMRIWELLRLCDGCEDWAEAIATLRPFMRHEAAG